MKFSENVVNGMNRRLNFSGDPDHGSGLRHW